MVQTWTDQKIACHLYPSSSHGLAHKIDVPFDQSNGFQFHQSSKLWSRLNKNRSFSLVARRFVVLCDTIYCTISNFRRRITVRSALLFVFQLLQFFTYSSMKPSTDECFLKAPRAWVNLSLGAARDNVKIYARAPHDWRFSIYGVLGDELHS